MRADQLTPMFRPAAAHALPAPHGARASLLCVGCVRAALLCACAPFESAAAAAPRDLHVDIGTLTCAVWEQDGRTWAGLRSGDTEFVAVAFDPATGEEDWSTQRFMGLDAEGLLKQGSSANAQALASYDCQIAACLWIPDRDTSIGSADEAALLAQLSDASPVETGVLNRQSQLFSGLVGPLVRPDSDANELFDQAWDEDACTLAPDFSFTAPCCRDHDRCYDRGGDGDDRLACDEGLRDCIADSGHPFIAAIYFGAVRAFGGVFFRNRR